MGLHLTDTISVNLAGYSLQVWMKCVDSSCQERREAAAGHGSTPYRHYIVYRAGSSPQLELLYGSTSNTICIACTTMSSRSLEGNCW